MRLWSMAGVIGGLCAAAGVSAASLAIAETSDGAADPPASESTLPPLPPPIDVPTVRTPQPPHDLKQPAAKPAQARPAAPNAVAEAPAPDVSLPPLSTPTDVPMHVPQPPHEAESAPPATTPRTAPPSRPTLPPAAATDMPPPPNLRPATPPASNRVVTAQRRSGTITLRPCRVIIEGESELAYARVCQMPDGSWKLTP